MSKEMLVVVLGIFTIVAPHLGVPSAWRTALIMAAGLLVTLLGFLLRGESLSRGAHRTESLPFVESTGVSDVQHGE